MSSSIVQPIVHGASFPLLVEWAYLLVDAVYYMQHQETSIVLSLLPSFPSCNSCTYHRANIEAIAASGSTCISCTDHWAIIEAIAAPLMHRAFVS